MLARLNRMFCLTALILLAGSARPAAPDKAADLWVLKPVVRPDVPAGVTDSPNPIDAFVAAECQAKGLTPAGPTDRRTLLRRVSLDLTGLPPTPAEQDAFLNDPSPDAYEKVVDRLLAGEQHGVRYARHWLDVLRYADEDERMIAAPGIHLWRDWVINALNADLPYDQFVRAQLTGYRSTVRTQMSATGYRSRSEPRPDDLFALGFLARGAVIRDGKDGQELAIAAVETVSTAFMGMTVGCAKCHDHMYDPITQRDFYAMKALFDPLVVRKVTLASPADLVAAGRAAEEAEKRRAEVERPLNELVAPYRQKLYDDRVAMLPPDVQAVVRKPEKERTAAEQKVADDYYPVLRIDADKITEVMPAEVRKKYQEFQRQLNEVGGRRRTGLPVVWTVEVDPRKATETSYVLTSGDPERPEKDHPVQPGWPFGPATPDFRDGRVEAFSDWLTAAENPLFARVAVNRLWQWHFGEGLHKLPSDFGKLGGVPANPRLLDWLAAEFVRSGFRMKAMHRLIITSETYKRASAADPAVAAADRKIDPTNTYLWHYPLRRLEAEPIWDSIFAAAGTLDSAVGGPSFDPAPSAGRRGGRRGADRSADAGRTRRAAYLVRGYSTSRDVTPTFLQAFDVDDGRTPCPMRTRTVTPPQSLFLMNSGAIDRASAAFAERVRKESGGDLGAAADLAYRIALARPPSAAERAQALAYLDNDPARLKGLAWLLFNLDEFVYVR
ncbi:MAG TPA: DUF1549 and DUF1553 domain-containing protein [Gemmataceae bacterium]|jgi:hypothetical protein